MGIDSTAAECASPEAQPGSGAAGLHIDGLYTRAVLAAELGLRHALGLPADTGRSKLIAEPRELAADPPVALARLEEFTGWLTIGLVNVVNMLAPELVVLRNLLAELPQPVVEAVAAQSARERSMVSRAVGYTRAERSGLGGESQLVGVAELAFDPAPDAAASAATA